MPPPKQNPIAPTFAPGTGARSSSTPAFMSATKRAGRGVGQRRRRLGLVGERAGAALLGEQVEASAE